MPTEEFQASKDLNIETGVLDDTNRDGSSLNVGVISEGGKLERVLFHFDFSIIPSIAIIDSSTLDLYLSQLNGDVSPVKLYRNIRPTWSETEATWIRYVSGDVWTLPGGDFTDADPVGADWTPGPVDAHNLIDITLLTQEAVSDETDHAKQLHLLLRYVDETPPVKYILVSQRTDSDPARRPKVVVVYHLPGWAVPIREAIFAHPGFSINYVPGGNVLSGDVVVQNNLVGVATQQISSGTLGALAVEGEFWFPKVGGLGINLGDKVYWDDVANVITKTSAGNIFVGRCIRLADPISVVVRVRLDQ
jgi:predicted RecA/RadA family phage recombinase